jgi:hypothetical protein
MTEPTPGYDPSNPRAAAKAAKAYAKATRPWYRKKRWWALAVIVVLGIIGAAAGGGGNSDGSGNKPAASDKTGAIDSSGASAKSSPAKGSAPTTKSAPAKKSTAGQVLMKSSGTGQKQTQEFTAAGNWDLAYNYDCSNAKGLELFQMYVYDGDGGLAGVGANSMEAKGNDVTHQHQGGTFYVEVNTACKWNIKATSAE